MPMIVRAMIIINKSNFIRCKIDIGQCKIACVSET